MPDVRREKKSVFSEQREWWADNNFHPLQQRPNDKKFKHENWWGRLGFSQIAVRSQQSGWTRVNLTNFHA